MELKNIKFSVILPILEREDIVKGFPMAIESIFQNTLIPDQVLVVVDGLVSKSFKGLIISKIRNSESMSEIVASRR